MLQNAITRRSNLLDSYLDKLVSADLYEAKMAEIENDIHSLRESVSRYEKLDMKIESTLEPARKFFLDCKTRAKIFLSSSPEQKKIMVNEVLWNITLKDGKVFDCKHKSAYSILSKVPENPTFNELLASLSQNRGRSSPVRTFLIPLF